MKVNICAPPVPCYQKPVIEGTVVQAFYNDPEALLRANMPQTVDLVEVLGLFKNFEGTYNGIFPGTSAFTLTNPVFNKKGDILFELRPHSQITASAPIVQKPVVRAVSTSTGTSRTYATAARPRVEHRGISRAYTLLSTVTFLVH